MSSSVRARWRPGAIGRAGRPGRSRAGLVMAGVAAAVLCAYAAVFAQLSHVDAVGSDYSTFHVAALVWRDGHASQLYDQAAETARHEQLVPPGYHVDLPFISPPTTVLLTAPFTLLDLATAFRVAALLQVALTAAAVAVALRAAPRAPWEGPLDRLATAAVALAGVGTLVLLLMGQWDGLAALGLACAYAAWRTGRLFAGGLVLALTIAPTKPHLAVGLAALLLGWRERRAIAGAAAGVVVTAAAGLVVAGPAGWTGWLGALRLSSSHSPLPSLLGSTGLAGSWLGDTAVARVIGLSGAAVAVAVCALLGDRLRRDPRNLEPVLGGAVALSLLGAPHLLMHDLALLAPAAAWTMSWAAARGRPQGRRALGFWLLLNLAALLDLGRSGQGPPGRLVPVALAAAGAVALAVTHRGRDAAAQPFPPTGAIRPPRRAGSPGSAWRGGGSRQSATGRRASP